MGLSNAAKGCIACGACTAVIAAIMIPVSILVIAPSMGQHGLDVATMNIPNSTVYDLPDNLHMDKVCKIFNNVHLDQTSLPFGAKLHETVLIMHVPAADLGWASWPPRNLGYFTMPEQDIKHGMNKFQVTADLTLMENTDDFVHWAFALTLGGFPNGTDVYIVGQPKMSALGIFHMDLKMGKKLHCTYVQPPLPPTATAPATVEEFVTARRLAEVRGMGPVTLVCDDHGNIDDDLRDTILDNYTYELDHPVTTSTTTTPPPTTTTTVPSNTTAPAVV